MIGFPKPTKRKTLKRRRSHLEVAIKQAVRAACVQRDGYCRLETDQMRAGHLLLPLTCAGPSEWAHWEQQKRARTRGMAPEQRHTIMGSLMLCRKHHRLYDSGRLQIVAHTDDGCNGPLEFV